MPLNIPIPVRDHTKLQNIGSLSHANIDTFIGTTIPATYAPLASPIFTENVTQTGTLGANSILNGTFDTDVSWSKGTGWTIAGGVAVATATTGNLNETVSTVVAGKYYQIVYDVVVTSGTYQVTAGGWTSDTISATATITRYFYAVTAGAVTFDGITSFTGTIDNVTLKEVVNSVVFDNAFLSTSDDTQPLVIKKVLDNPTGNQAAMELNYRTNKTAGNDIGLLINMLDTASPGTSYPIDVRVGGVSKFSVNNVGMVTSAWYFLGSLIGNAVSATENDTTLVLQGRNFTTTDNAIEMASGTFSGAGVTQAPVVIKPTYNQTTTSSATDLLINRTETAVGSGAQRLISAGTGGGSYVENFGVSNTGAVTGLTFNGLTPTAQTTGFTIAGGTTPKTLTIPLDASVSGTNTGDNATNTQYAGLKNNVKTVCASGCDYATLNAAITGLGATQTTVIISESVATTTATVPTTMTVQFIGQGMLTLATGQILTFDVGSSLIADPNKQIFSCYTTETCVVGLTEVYSEWWGTIPDGTTGSKTAMQTTINSVYASGGGTVKLNDGTYLLDSIESSYYVLKSKDKVNVVGNGPQSILKVANGLRDETHGICVLYNHTELVSNLRIANLTIDYNGQNNLFGSGWGSVPAVNRTGGNIAQNVTIENVHFKNSAGAHFIWFGVYTDDSRNENDQVINCIFQECGRSIAGNYITDHSSIYTGAKRQKIIGNTFTNSTKEYYASALDIHGDGTVMIGNTVENYAVGANIAADVNSTLNDITFDTNILRNVSTGIGLWQSCASGCAVDAKMGNIKITNNIILITDNESIGASYGVIGYGQDLSTANPKNIEISGNIIGQYNVDTSGFVSVNTGIMLKPITNLIIKNNTFFDLKGNAFWIGDYGSRTGSNYHITNNNINKCGYTSDGTRKNSIQIGTELSIANVNVSNNEIIAGHYGSATDMTHGISFTTPLSAFTDLEVFNNKIIGAVTAPYENVTAPLQLISGTLLASPIAGKIEFLTDAYYGTITTGSARKTFAFLESPTFTGTVTIPTSFTLGAVSVTSTGTQLNYLNGATGITGSGSTVFGTSPTITSPVITNIAPGANFTLTQNSVFSFVSEYTGAVANTLYLKTGYVGIGTTPSYVFHIQPSGTSSVGLSWVAGTTSAVYSFGIAHTLANSSASSYAIYLAPVFSPTGNVTTLYSQYVNGGVSASTYNITTLYGSYTLLNTTATYTGILSAGYANMIYAPTFSGSRPNQQTGLNIVNQGLALAISTVTFSGSGLNDLTLGATFTGTQKVNYKVQIDGTGTPDTFKWSDDGGSTWDAETVAITGSAQTLNNEFTITFAATTGHTLNDNWTFNARNVIGTAYGIYVAAQANATTNYDLYLAGGSIYVGATKAGVGASTLCWDGSGGSYWGACTSLKKNKENIIDMPLGLEAVLKLTPREFDWKSDGHHDAGFIAEETEAVSPLLVEYTTSKDNEPRILSNINEKGIIGALVNAVKELNQKIEKLEAK